MKCPSVDLPKSHWSISFKDVPKEIIWLMSSMLYTVILMPAQALDMNLHIYHFLVLPYLNDCQPVPESDEKGNTYSELQGYFMDQSIGHIKLEMDRLLCDDVRVQPCILNSVLFWCISKASPKLFHILWCIAYQTLHATQLCTAPCICTSACAAPTCLFVCLFVSPSGLFLLIDGQWTSAKSDCTHSIRRGLGRRLRNSLLLNPSPRCNPPCRIVY